MHGSYVTFALIVVRTFVVISGSFHKIAPLSLFVFFSICHDLAGSFDLVDGCLASDLFNACL